MGRKKLDESVKAKIWTIRVYDWEKEKVRNFIKEMRGKKK